MEAFNIEDQVRLLRRVPLRAGCAILSELLLPAGRLARAGAELTLSMGVQAAILARSTQLSAQHREYLVKHPALTELMHDFLTNVLVNKPDDCYQFCQVSRVRAPPPESARTVAWKREMNNVALPACTCTPRSAFTRVYTIYREHILQRPACMRVLSHGRFRSMLRGS
jgi:hypothetical protein